MSSERGTEILINRALIRPILFCGTEKNAAVIYGGISLVIIVAKNFMVSGLLLGAFIFVCGHLFFHWLAKKDPQMIAIYKRHILYRQGYFPARGGGRTNPLNIPVRSTVWQKR